MDRSTTATDGVGRGARRFDLHLHSTRSDGRLEPDEVLARCAAGGLDVVALTDHDLVAPLEPGLHRVGDRTVRLIGGAEVSGQHDGREYHLLVYFPGDVPAAFRAFCEARAIARGERYDAAVGSLGLSGVSPADDTARSGRRSLTRHHLARALVAAGHARDVRDAFARYAGGAHGHVPRIGLSFVDAIAVARSHGGVTSWAHPPLPAVEQHLETFVAAGLQGLEAWRPWTDRAHQKKLQRVARRHGLFLTGGSDWHGWTEPDPGTFSVGPDRLRGFLDALAVAA